MATPNASRRSPPRRRAPGAARASGRSGARGRQAPRRLLAWGALVALSACPRQLRFGPEGEIRDPAEIVRRLDERAARIRSLKAEAKVTIIAPQSSGSAGEFIAAVRPASLHLETLDFFGKPIAVLATDGERLALYRAEEETLYTGPATASNVARLLPLALEPREAVELLLGGVPRLAGAGASAQLGLDERRRSYVLTLTAGAVTQRIFVATEDLRPLGSQTRGADAYDLELDDYRDVDGVAFPTAVEISTVDARGLPSGLRVGIRYRDVELNPALPPDLFVLEPPATARRVELDGEGRRVPPPGTAP